MALDAAASRKILDKLLGFARKQAPGADASATLRVGRDGNTRFAQNRITSSGDVETTQVEIELAFGQCHASAAVNQTDDASLRELVARAARLAQLSPEDPERMPLPGAQKYVAVKGAFDPGTDALGAVARAEAAGSAIHAGQAKQLEVAGFYQHHGSSLALATSSGLFAHHRWTGAGFTCTARTKDGTGSGWAGAASNLGSAVDAAAAAGIAVDKAVRSARPKRLEPGRYTVILEPAAVGALTSFLVWSLDARQADEGRSFFSKPGGGNRIGDTILGPNVTLRSEPTDAGLEAAPFDDEGMATPAVNWIDQGKLTNLIHTRFWARKQGKPATGRPSGWQLAGGTTPRAELLKGVKRGVLITRFWYLRWVDPQSVLATGLTRDGVFLVENGEIVAPVNNFRFNESPLVMLKNAEAMSPAEISPPSGDAMRMRVPALRTHEFNLASISDAV